MAEFHLDLDAIFWSADVGTGMYRYISPQVQRILGYSPEEWLQSDKFWEQHVHQNDLQAVLSARAGREDEGASSVLEYRMRAADGSWKWLLDRSNIVEEQGVLTRKGILIEINGPSQAVPGNTGFDHNEHFQRLVQLSSESILDLDVTTNRLYVSESFTRHFGHQLSDPESNRQLLQSLVHPDDREAMIRTFGEALADPKREVRKVTYRLRRADNDYALVEDHQIILRDEHGKAYRTLGSLKDITSVDFYHRLDDIERDVMAHSLRHDTSLASLLDPYLARLESLFTGLWVSVMRVEDEKIWCLSAPSVPEVLLKAIDGLSIGPKAGSCGTAAYLGKTTIVEDVFQDERWQDFSHLAENFGFSSCWSEPIFDAKGQCVATMAFYNPVARSPNPIEQVVLGRSSQLLSLIFTRFQYLDEIRQNNERNYYVNQATKDAIYDWTVKDDQLHWGDGFERLFGHKLGIGRDLTASAWLEHIHPDDRDAVQSSLERYLQVPTDERWERAYRFRRADGTYAYVEEVGYLIRDGAGEPQRMIGALRDVSSSKLQEMKVQIEQELSPLFNEHSRLSLALGPVLQYLTKFRGFAAAEVWLTNSTADHINLAASYGADQRARKFFESLPQIKRLNQGQSLPGMVWKQGHFQIWDDLGSRADFFAVQAADKAGLVSAFGLPLYQHGAFTGVLLLYSRVSIAEDLTLTEPYLGLSEFLGVELNRKQQEEQMYLLFESAPDILAIAAPSGNFVRANPAFCNLLGYSEEEIVGRPFAEFLHPRDRSRTQVEYQETISGKRKADNFVNRYRTHSGEYRWISWSSSLPFDEEGLVFSYGRDITELVELQELFDSASKLARVGSWEYRLADNSTYWSEVTRDIHGVDKNFMPGFDNLSIFYKDPGSWKRLNDAIKIAIEVGTSYDLDLLLTNSSGVERWVRTIGNTEFVNGRCVRLYGSFQDIHQQKLIQIELARKNRFLETASNIVKQLLKSEKWSSALVSIFKLAAVATNIDRVCYLQCIDREGTSNVLMNLEYEWVRKPFEARAADQTFEHFSLSALAADDYEQLMRGDAVRVCTSDLPKGALRRSLEKYSTQAVMLQPIVFEKKLHGFLSFEDCHQKREWTGDESWLFNSVRSSMLAAIQRDEIQSSFEQTFKERNDILESIGDGFVTLSEDWTVTYWNNKAERLTGVSKKQIVGQILWDVFSDIQGTLFEQHYREVMRDRKTVTFEAFYQALGKWFDISVYPADKGISIIFRDITQRKDFEARLLESNERFEKVSEATKDAIWDWDVESDTVYLGAGFSRLLGYEVEKFSLASRVWKTPIHPDDLDRVLNSLHQAVVDRNVSNWQCEYRYRQSDGDYIFVADSGVIIRSEEGRALRVVGAMRDISESKRHEEDLIRLNEQLRLYADKLEGSNRELEQFAYVASHDLQEPLRMVSSFLGLLESRYADQLDDTAIEYIDFAVDGSIRMRQIILDLLSYSRIGKESGELEKISIQDVVEEICSLYQEAIDENSAQISCIGEMPTVNGYKSPIQQIFQNLIGNALKYRSPDRNPKILIRVSDEGPHWLFAVEDNGLGIEPQYFDKIFVIFQRLHTKDEYEGTGIGLSVVKRAVEQLGGQIWLESVPNQESTFYFTLPKILLLAGDKAVH